MPSAGVCYIEHIVTINTARFLKQISQVTFPSVFKTTRRYKQYVCTVDPDRLNMESRMYASNMKSRNCSIKGKAPKSRAA